MRLTLRTLLAWMDGTLEPAQQAEITARVNALSSASGLVARIQRLRVTRGSGATPGKSTPPLTDPNLVASYLDNTLPSAAVVEFERICLDSDQQLLEVAACHQVLARVANGPVQVPRRLRERSYGLGPSVPAMTVDLPPGARHRMPTDPAAPRVESLTDAAGVRESAATTDSGEFRAGSPSRRVESNAPPANHPVRVTREAEVASLDATLPEFLRERPAARWPWVVVGGLVLAGWLGLAVRTSPWGRRFGLSPAGTHEVAADNLAANSGANPADPGAPPGAGTEARSGPSEAPLGQPVEPPPGGAQTMPTAVLDPLNDDLPNRFDRSVAGRAVSNPDEPPADAAAEERSAAPSQTRVAQVAAAEGLALAWTPERSEWFLLPDKAEVFSDNLVVVPPSFETVLVIPGGQLQVLGGSRLGWSAGEDGVLPVCRLDLGRVILRASGDEAGPPLVTLFELANQLWRLELPPGVTVAVEVLPLSPTEVEQPVRSHNRTGRIHLKAGRMQVTRLGDEPQALALEGPDLLELAAGPLITELAERRQRSTAGPVDWSEAPRRLTLSAKSTAAQFRKLFTPGEGVEEGLLGAASGTEPRPSELATATLGLIGKSESLVAILQSTRHGEARLQAISGLRRCLLEEEFHRELIREGLTQRFAPAVAQQVERLLWGYSVADARTPEATMQLLEALNSPDVAVRELAITHLRELTGRDFDYQASGSEMQRSSGARAWRQLVSRNGGTLLKAPQPAIPNDGN